MLGERAGAVGNLGRDEGIVDVVEIDRPERLAGDRQGSVVPGVLAPLRPRGSRVGALAFARRYQKRYDWPQVPVGP